MLVLPRFRSTRSSRTAISSCCGSSTRGNPPRPFCSSFIIQDRNPYSKPRSRGASGFVREIRRNRERSLAAAMASASVSGGGLGGLGSSGSGNAALIRTILAKLVEFAKKAAAQQRPWPELVDRSAFAKPESLSDALTRIRKNLGYFRANYLAVLFAVVVLSMLWNPISILVLALLGTAWAYLFVVRAEPLVVGNRTLSEREKLIGMAAISILVVFGITSVGSILISGVIVGFAAICLHGAFRVPDDLFLDDNDTGSFLTFFGLGPAATLPTQMPSTL